MSMFPIVVKPGMSIIVNIGQAIYRESENYKNVKVNNQPAKSDEVSEQFSSNKN